MEVCYDERGHKYSVPAYCYSEPLELTDQPHGHNDGVATTISLAGGEGNLSKRIPTGSPMSIKLRINPGDHSLGLQCHSNDSISDIKKLIQALTIEVHFSNFRHKIISHFSFHIEFFPPQLKDDPNKRIPICEENRQRIMFMGKELKNQQVEQSFFFFFLLIYKFDFPLAFLTFKTLEFLDTGTDRNS